LPKKEDGCESDAEAVKEVMLSSRNGGTEKNRGTNSAGQIDQWRKEGRRGGLKQMKDGGLV